jgi:hypothetical protein
VASVRNISEHTVDLRCIGRSVAPDERVDVPDDVFKSHEWADTVWDTDGPKAAEKSTAKKES